MTYHDTELSLAVQRQSAKKPWIRSITVLSLRRNKPESGSDCRDIVPENPAKCPDLAIFRKPDIWGLFDKNPYNAPGF
jgi:hypothetical protein